MNETLDKLIKYGRETKCSDVHIGEGSPITYRRNGELMFHPVPFQDVDIIEMILSMINEKQKKVLDSGLDLDLVYVTSDGERQRVNIYREQKRLCAAIRIINNEILSLDQLRMPEILKKLAEEPRGLVLLTGPTGSGKSTTLAAVIDYINEHRSCHILTIEDPVEYVYERKKALIHQREIGDDVESFDVALRSAMREDPDVILVGEMRDYETIAAVVTLAETGHLVFSTLHTIGAAKTVDRIIDVFPPEKQEQIRIQLAGILQAVITQTLLPDTTGGRVAALEIMTGSDAVRNLIRENKGYQLTSVIQTSKHEGMQTLNFSLAQLIRSGQIEQRIAEQYSDDVEELRSYLH